GRRLEDRDLDHHDHPSGHHDDPSGDEHDPPGDDHHQGQVLSDGSADGSALAPEVVAALSPLVADPSATAILTDFDGTLASIITDPAAVEPLPGVASTLAGLAARFGRVAVVSGRPVSFLAEQLAGAGELQLVGLYGLERSGGHGEVIAAPGAEPWRRVVEAAVTRLDSAAPAGVTVEPKALTVTIHWRRDPALAPVAIGLAEAEAAATGLVPHSGRMSIELRPPLAVDKGTAVAGLVEGYRAAAYLGDDLGDLPAFAALDAASSQGMVTVKVAAVDGESPPEVAAAADVVVDGPAGSLAVLGWLADRARNGGQGRER
ncbi:MAG TPA: trehalose-phosphatase, partial [Acidimicrobiales bacterium]|nr:trehalose-phosphatase [Acidimicrobiales bacterium]